ncbi:MAG: hypothetical protein AAGL24_23195 [Pseudomonadota bacterium]
MNETISNEDLTAYLDGELAEDHRRRIEEAVAADADLSARLEALDVPIDAANPVFDALLDTAPECPSVHPAPRSVPRISRMLAAVLVVLGVGIGVLASPLLNRDTQTDWKMAVANYQLLYVPETLAGGPPDPERAAAHLARLSDDLGRDLSGAFSVAELDFRRAQMLGLEAEPLIQIAYLSEDNVPFAICITPVDDPSYAPTAEKLAGLAAAHWVDDGFGFLVIGGDDLGLVRRVAANLKGRL